MNLGTFVWRILSSPSNRGTLLPSDVTWNHQIAGRKSLPHTLAEFCRICVGLLCPAFIFPGTSWLPNKNPAPTFWKVFRFTRRFVTKGSREKRQGTLSKVHSEAASKLCNHLKLNYFQKKWEKRPFSLPTEWGDFFSAVKLHIGSGLELCIPLKMKNFQKMVVKIALPMPRPWGASLVYLDNWMTVRGDIQLAKCAAI